MATVLVVTGCASTSSSQNIKVVTNAQGVPNYYRVKSGDTVSGIASRYNMNYRKIGQLNNLNSSYTIYAGQWLKLWEGTSTASSSSYGSSTTNSSSSYTTNNSSAYSHTNSSVPQTNNSYQNNYPSNYTNNYTSNTTQQSSGSFKYPTSNPVSFQYDTSNSILGMWFSGSQGDPVYASQSGSVIYAGNGLQEYGNLVMINHGNDYVTAYAHNSQILVKEGDTVRQGQQIASMGNTGNTNGVALEFQVRQGGRAIDPRRVLSK